MDDRHGKTLAYQRTFLWAALFKNDLQLFQGGLLFYSFMRVGGGLR
jgi:hypothetical protein